MKGMMRSLLTGLAVAVLAFGYTTIDFERPPVMREVEYSPYQAVWTPQVSTDCEVWEIRQRDAALEDVWPNVDYMRIDGDAYGSDPVTLPRDGDKTFTFEFWSEGEAVYRVDLEVDTRC